MPDTRYSLHPSFRHAAAIAANLPATTGRSLTEWLGLVAADAPESERARRVWLKSEFGLGLATVSVILAAMRGELDPDSYDPEGLVGAMYADRPGLRPMHERLLDLALALGPDVRACPCATMVPLYRRHVFAQLKPATRSRLDLGLALGGTPAAGRLVDTGGRGRGDRITHRIALARVDEVDDEVGRLLRAAYLADG